MGGEKGHAWDNVNKKNKTLHVFSAKRFEKEANNFWKSYRNTGHESQPSMGNVMSGVL